MNRSSIAFLAGGLFVTGCFFPSFDDMKGGDGARADDVSTAGATTTSTADPTETTPQTDAAPSAVDASASTFDAATPDAAKAVVATRSPTASVECNTGGTCSGSSFCCSRTSTNICTTSRDTCLGGADGHALECDDKSDCVNGVCCWVEGAKTATCATTCNTGVLLCRSSTSCPTGKSCVGRETSGSGGIEHWWGVNTPVCQ